MDNALKYSKEQPNILVHIVSHPGFLELRVTDNGIGIPKEYKSKVFEEFLECPVEISII